MNEKYTSEICIRCEKKKPRRDFQRNSKVYKSCNECSLKIQKTIDECFCEASKLIEGAYNVKGSS